MENWKTLHLDQLAYLGPLWVRLPNIDVTQSMSLTEILCVSANQVENGLEWSQDANVLVCIRLYQHHKVCTAMVSPPSAVFVCDALDDPENGQVVVSGQTLGSFAKYSCNDGYVLVGFRFRKCLTTGWSGDAPFCKREHKSH